MADLQMKTIRYPGINNLYRFMQPDGTYPDLTAGNIISNDAYNENTEPYLFRALPYKSKRLVEDLVGGTVVWNQKFGELGYDYWVKTTQTNLFVSNGIATMTLNTPPTRTYDTAIIYKNFKAIANHKYLVSVVAKVPRDGTFTCDSNTVFGANKNFTLLANVWSNVAFIGTRTTDLENDIYFFPNAITGSYVNGDSWQMKEAVAVDLTQFFGNATIADAIYAMEQAQSGSGIAFMRKYFPELFDAEYDAGTFKSVNPTAHVTTGKNLYDKSKTNTSNGYRASYYVKGSDGTESSNATYNISEYFRVLPNTEYTISGTYGSQPGICFYDGNKNFISGLGYGVAQSTPYKTFTTPSNAVYARCSIAASLVDELQLELGGTRTTYVPYEEHTYDLGNVPLYGLFQLENGKLKAYGDVRHAEGGTDRKFGVVTFDSSSWTLYDQNTTNIRFAISKTIPLGKTNSANVIFTGGGTWSVGDTAAETNTNKLDIRASIIVVSIAKSIFTGSTGTEFGAYMNGKGFVYEKATPTTEDTPSFEKIQSCFPYGTEQYITTNDVPVGHNTKYFKDVVSSIAGIPEPPSGNGTYELKLTVTDGVASYSWVAV